MYTCQSVSKYDKINRTQIQGAGEDTERRKFQMLILATQREATILDTSGSII